MAEEDAVGWTDNTSLRAQIVPQTPTLTNSVRSTTPAGVEVAKTARALNQSPLSTASYIPFYLNQDSN